MTAPLNFFKVSFLLLTSLAMVACHSDGPSKPATPDINTLNIYTLDQTIYSFNEETGIPTKRGEFNLGDNQFIELNTDEDKQGYEYAVFVFENKIKLLDYDKASSGRIIELAELYSSQVICGLIPHKKASQASFSDQRKSNRSTLDKPVITIEYQNNNQACNPDTNVRDTLDFTSVIEDYESTNDIVKTSGKSENVLGGHIIDYLSNNTLTQTDSDDETEYGSYGFLGWKTNRINTDLIETLVFNYKIDDVYDEWEKTFSPSTGIKVIKQVSNNQVLVQEGKKVFILKTSNLFTINTEDNNTPVQERIDAMFSSPYLSLETDEPITSNTSQNGDTFVIKQGNILNYYESEKFTQIPIDESSSAQNATKIKFDLTSDNTVLVIQEANNIQTLVAISTVSGLSTTILSAEKIEFYIVNDTFYVNTLELNEGAGWQAHWFTKSNNEFTSTSYDNSRFLFIQNLQEELNSIYLLSSDDEVPSSNMSKPSLYKYDSTQSNGRKKGSSENDGIVDFSFGKLNTNVSNIISTIIVNDEYGRIILQGINEDSGVGRAVEEHYYFNPSQTIANPDLNEQSLTLIKRIYL